MLSPVSPFTMLSILALIAVLAPLSMSQYPNFTTYLTTYNKSYPNETQYITRNTLYTNRVNSFSSITDYTPAVNNFTDWSLYQFSLLMNQVQSIDRERVASPAVPERSADNSVWDWRDSNIITEVKSQSTCGNSWAYAANGLMEAYLIRNRGSSSSVDLSESYLSTCIPNHNCNSGSVAYALDRMSVYAATETQFAKSLSYFSPSSRTYIPVQSICLPSGILTGVQKKVYYGISQQDLISIIQKGPVVALVSAQNWHSYGSGVIKCPSATQVSHAVMVIGYTSTAYLIKNSWGQNWGTGGYGFVSRERNLDCLIRNQVYYLG